ncbi:MAG: hypothetical protein ACKOW3_05630 [Hyphomicrobium sp.]
MKYISRNLLSLLFLTSLPSLTFADTKPSAQETEKLKSALSSMGCKGGEMEKERNGVFEVDDTKCQGGEYDIKFNENFNVIEKERD